MTSFSFILSLVMIGGVAVGCIFASFTAKRLRVKEKGRYKVALDDWEDEGGSVVTDDDAGDERGNRG